MAVLLPFGLVGVALMAWRGNPSPPAKRAEVRSEETTSPEKSPQRSGETAENAKAKTGPGAKPEAKSNQDPAETKLREELAALEKQLGAEHRDTLRLARNLGLLLEKKGDTRGAETHLRRASEGFERALGADDPETLSCLHDLAFVLLKRRDNDRAEQIFRRVAAGRELLRYANDGFIKSVYGEKDADAARARNLLQQLGADVRGGSGR